ncbi:MAG: hypothetical protein JNL58_21120 [Planctomyces sp.]|nr:hypothetical protein [Planctomyces sp.]
MDFKSYELALQREPFDEFTVREILDQFFQNGRPYIFHDAPQSHAQFKRNVSIAIESTFGLSIHHLTDIFICGSAHLGFSAVPGHKFGRIFSPESSDIDLAIVNTELFDRWWAQLAHPLTSLGKTQPEIADNLLNGLISPNMAHSSTGVGRKWWDLFGGLEVNGFRKVRGRIYRTAQFMENYHRRTVIRGREWVKGAKEDSYF